MMSVNKKVKKKEGSKIKIKRISDARLTESELQKRKKRERR